MWLITVKKYREYGGGWGLPVWSQAFVGADVEGMGIPVRKASAKVPWRELDRTEAPDEMVSGAGQRSTWAYPITETLAMALKVTRIPKGL